MGGETEGEMFPLIKKGGKRQEKAHLPGQKKGRSSPKEGRKTHRSQKGGGVRRAKGHVKAEGSRKKGGRKELPGKGENLWGVKEDPQERLS